MRNKQCGVNDDIGKIELEKKENQNLSIIWCIIEDINNGNKGNYAEKG